MSSSLLVSLPAFLPLFALFFPVSSPCFLSHSFLVFPFSVFYLVDLFTFLPLSPLFSLVLLFLPPNLIASFLFPSPLLSSVLVTSSYSLFPLLSASICSFLLAYTNISFPFLLSSSLSQFPSSVSLLPLFFFFPCSFLISLDSFFSCPHFLGSTPFLLLTFPVLILFPSSSPLPFPFLPILHLLVHSPISPLLPCFLFFLSSHLRFLSSWPPCPLLSPRSAVSSCGWHPPSSPVRYISSLHPFSSSPQRRRRGGGGQIFLSQSSDSRTAQWSQHRFSACLQLSDRQTDALVLLFSSLSSSHEDDAPKKKPDCPRWPIRTSKLRVVLDQEGSRTENTDVRLNRNLKIHLSVCKFWFLSFFLFPSLSPLLVLALKSSLSAWFFWGAALRFLSPRSSRKRFSSFWPVAISLADVSLRCFASHHFSLWARPSLPSSPPLSLCLLHPLSASQVSAGLNAWGASTRIVLVFRPRRRENLSFVRFVS